MRIPDALRKPRTIAEIFIIGNLAFLAIDVYVAHLTNAFERRPEWLPVIFSIAAPLLLMLAKRWTGMLVGCLSLLVGIGGMLITCNRSSSPRRRSAISSTPRRSSRRSPTRDSACC